MSGFGFIPYSDMPPEWQAQVDESRRQHDMYHATVENEQHNLETLFSDMSGPDTLTLVKWLINLLHNSSSDIQISMAIGDLNRQLKTKMNVCPACGKNHDEELRKAMDTVPQDGEDPEANAARMLAALDTMPTAPEPTKEPEPDVRAPTRAELLQEYNLEEGITPGTVICLGCGMKSISLKDRMLEPAGVDGCHGCQHKAKWGG